MTSVTPLNTTLSSSPRSHTPRSPLFAFDRLINTERFRPGVLRGRKLAQVQGSCFDENGVHLLGTTVSGAVTALYPVVKCEDIYWTHLYAVRFNGPLPPLEQPQDRVIVRSVDEAVIGVIFGGDRKSGIVNMAPVSDPTQPPSFMEPNPAYSPTSLTEPRFRYRYNDPTEIDYGKEKASSRSSIWKMTDMIREFVDPGIFMGLAHRPWHDPASAGYGKIDYVSRFPVMGL